MPGPRGRPILWQMSSVLSGGEGMVIEFFGGIGWRGKEKEETVVVMGLCAS